jgi:response regulator NasT
MDRTVAPLPGLKVVVVDDDPVVCTYLRETLPAQFGHQVVGEASNGTDMVRLVLERKPDLVIFDVHLPGLNGLDALRQIAQERPVAAVAITADGDPTLLQRAVEDHVAGYLVKPLDPRHLGPALQLARAHFVAVQSLHAENESLKKTLENRKIIERAKGALMKRHRWSEAEAFRRLQRGAMNRRTTMVELAKDVLNGIDIDL